MLVELLKIKKEEKAEREDKVEKDLIGKQESRREVGEEGKK